MFSRRRLIVIACAAVLALGGCSRGSGTAMTQPTTPGPSGARISTSNNLGEETSDGPRAGHYSPIVGQQSYTLISQPSTTTTDEGHPVQNGLLLSVKAVNGAVFIASMEEDAYSYLRVNPGWTVTQVGREPSWRPVECASVPHAVVGGRWVVMLRTLDTPASEAGDQPPVVLLEVYDLTTHQFETANAAKNGRTTLSQSMVQIDDHRVSFLWIDGDPQDGLAHPLYRRTLDLDTFAFTDDAVDVGTRAIADATAVPGGYTFDLEENGRARSGVFVHLDDHAAGSPYSLTMTEATQPRSTDGVRVDGTPGALQLVGDGGAKPIALPADFQSVTVVKATATIAYITYTSGAAKAISADGLATVDLSKGSIQAAFDLTGQNQDATGPVATGGWTTGKSRVLFVGVA